MRSAWARSGGLLVCLGLALGSFAGGSGAGASGEKPLGERLKGFATPEARPVKAKLIAEHASLQPGGKTRVGVSFELDEGWHIYADPPGDAGLATTVALSTVRSAALGPWQWPEPERFVEPGDIRTNGYSGTLVVSRALSLPSYVQGLDMIVLRATVKWLACKEICLPGSAELELTLPVSETAPAISTHANWFDQPT